MLYRAATCRTQIPFESVFSQPVCAAVVRFEVKLVSSMKHLVSNRIFMRPILQRIELEPHKLVNDTKAEKKRKEFQAKYVCSAA